MIAHTPGPWVVDIGYDAHIVHNDDMYFICEIRDYNGYAENKANARLIAAAPELLDALIVLWAEEWRDDDDVILIEARTQARLAIAKARGEV